MSEFTLPLRLVYTLSLLLVITSLLAVELRRLRSSTLAYVAQALLIVSLITCFATQNHALYWWAATALVTKAILIPWFLFRVVPRDAREVAPLVGLGPSVVIAALLMTAAFKLTHAQFEGLAPPGITVEEIYRTNLGVGATVFMLGLYALLTRRDAIKTVVGLCLLENGVHLSLISLAPALSETALFGVATEVVVTVYLLLYVIRGVEREFGTTDTMQLRALQW